MTHNLSEARALFLDNRLDELDALMSSNYMKANVDQLEFNQGPMPTETLFLKYMVAKHKCRVAYINHHTYLLHKLNITDPTLDITHNYITKQLE